MKKILILLFILPFFAKAQVPTLNRDTTYVLKALDAGVAVFRDAIYLPKLSNSDTALFVQIDIFGKVILRKFAVTDTQYLRRDININTAQGIANAAAIQQRLLIGDTAGIRLQPTAGSNVTITGIYPFLTFNSTRPIYQQTGIPYANSLGNLISDSTKLAYANDYLYIASTGGAASNGILMNGGRAEINGQFTGMYFNVGSGKAGGGTYDASKGYVFQNRGNTIFQISTSAVTSGVNTAAFTANLTATGTIKAGGYTVANLPAAGIVGRTAYITDASSPTYLGTLTGGGTTKCPVFDNGTAWVSH